MSNQRTRGSARPVLVPDPLDVNAQVRVAKGGQSVGVRRTVNFVEGDNTTLTVAEDPQNERVNVTIAETPSYARALLLMGG